MRSPRPLKAVVRAWVGGLACRMVGSVCDGEAKGFKRFGLFSSTSRQRMCSLQWGQR